MIIFYRVPTLSWWAYLQNGLLPVIAFFLQGVEKKGWIGLNLYFGVIASQNGETLLPHPNPGEALMTHKDEKRAYVRCELDIPIVYAFQDSDQFNPARLFNYCKGGMCFEVGEALEPGADIYIMMENLLPDSIDAEFYDGYRAEVRWCRKHSFEPAEQFRVGVKYYQTIIK
jgi:hypothetical protein